MRKGFALPLIIGLVTVIVLITILLVFFKLKNPNFKPVEVTVSGTVISNFPPKDQSDYASFTLKKEDNSQIDVLYQQGKDSCANKSSEEQGATLKTGDKVEIYGMNYGTTIQICAFQKYYIKLLEKSSLPLVTPSPTADIQKKPIDSKPMILKSFTDSKGKEKFVVLDFNKETIGNDYNNIYISLKKDDTAHAIKIVNVQGSSLDKSPFISTNSGVKYLIIAQYGPGDGQQFTLVDENGKNIGIGLQTMGLGTKIPGMYGLQFGKWIGDTTEFTITAISGNGHSYEATFDAPTGKQVGETKQTD